MQQARNLYNARKCDKGIPSAYVLHRLLPRVNYENGTFSNVPFRLHILANKWWVRLVPAAAVTPAPRVGIMFIGPKASVAGLVNFL